MMKLFSLAVTALLLGSMSLGAQPTGACPVIPQVARYVSAGEGSFNLSPGSTYSLKLSGLKEDASAFKAYIENCDLALTPGKKAVVRFIIDPSAFKSNLPEGAYKLEVGKKGIDIRSASYEGAFYAVQSLIQLQQHGAIPYCRIEDYPRYGYRGLMFDVVRHFRSKEAVLKQLDAMALLKLNVMHFHITDNEAWRIKLDCAPEMAIEDFYTKDDIREIIAYAAARHIDVVPEIEIPGHNRALLKVHPEFYCSGDHVVDNVFCIGKEEPFEFFFRVLEEVMELFPSQFMHIGGDEADKDNWKLCPLCKERIAKEGLKDEFELQSYCIGRVDQFVSAHGKRMIGWDEILEGGLSPNATVMSWRGTAGGLKAIGMGHDVIMTPNTYLYLDYGQDAPWKEPAAFNYYLPLKTVYEYEPEDGIDAPEHLLGVQGNLWTELVVTDNHFEYMLYPRAFAIAEVGWSQKGSKDFTTFREKARFLCGVLRSKGYTCFDLDTEYGDRPESLNKIPRITQNAKAVMYIGSNDKTGRETPALVDGYLGGWAMKGNTKWVTANTRAVTIDVDLGEVMDIHYVGAEFVDYKLRRFQAPPDTEFFVSADGKNYEPLPIGQIKLSPDRQGYAILTAGGTVNVQARYVRLKYNTGKVRVRAFISELIVN